MLSIDDERAERAAIRLAECWGVTVAEAVAIACDRMRWAEFYRVRAEAPKRFPMPAEPEERARLADHSHLYGPDGLPK
jgi:hypothetical protein